MTLPILTAAREHPGRIAFLDKDVRIDYAELKQAIQKHQVMRHPKVKPGDHVAWCPDNDLDAFLTFWSLLCRGAVACPISHRFPIGRQQEIAARLDAHWLPELLAVQDEAKSLNHEVEDDPTKPATVILTSGSSGHPKAVVHSMAAHIASATGAATNMPIEPDDRWLWSLPLFHISGLSILVRCAIAGATVVGSGSSNKLSADLLEEFEVSHLSVVTSQLRDLLNEPNFPSDALKYVLLGGSRVDPRLVQTARKRGVRVLTTYGLTETGSQVTTSTSRDDPDKSGRLLPGRELQISTTGEILVRGETLCLGYYEDGKITSVVDDQGWFLTKDLGNLGPDQQLTVVGRRDNMFISGGENIHPENIERAMMQAFEIEQVVVVPKANSQYGSRPVAFVLGKLPEDWESSLEGQLKRFEIPIAIQPWPKLPEASIKPDRNQFIAIANQT